MPRADFVRVKSISVVRHFNLVVVGHIPEKNLLKKAYAGLDRFLWYFSVASAGENKPLCKLVERPVKNDHNIQSLAVTFRLITELLGSPAFGTRCRSRGAPGARASP